MNNTQKFCYRPMQISDLEQVFCIENEANAFPWQNKQFTESIRHHQCWVLERNQQIIAYLIYRFIQDEGEILTIAVHLTFRQQGYAQFMLNQLFTQAKQHAINKLFLEVRASNQTAQKLYAKMGFHLHGCRKNYYPSTQGREDALLLTKVCS